jgi:hypothetical protein
LPSDKFLEQPKIAKRLTDDKDIFRIYSLTQYDQNPYGILGWKKNQDTLLAGLKRRHRLENFLLKENRSPVITGKILGTFNVKYIISFAESIGIEIEKIEEYDLGEQFASSLKLFKNNQVIPRVLFLPEAKVVEDEEAAFKRLIALEFLPTKTVILEKQPSNLPPQFTGILDDFRKQNPVTITSYQNTQVIIEADVKSHGFLVLSDINYPGWKAQVDGNQQEILQANYLVRALELEPGTHTIRFYFDPLSFRLGAAISIITLTIILILSGLSLIRKKIRSPKKAKL